MLTVNSTLAKILEPGIRATFAKSLSFPWQYELFIDDDPMMGIRVNVKTFIEGKHYGAGIMIERVLVEDDQYSLIERNIATLAKLMERTILKMGTEDDIVIPTEEIRSHLCETKWYLNGQQPDMVWFDDVEGEKYAY